MNKHGYGVVGALLVAASLVACGGGGGGGNGAQGGGSGSMRDPSAPPPDIDGTLLIQDLTADELGQLCDWFSIMASGGYGQLECSDGSIAVPTSGSQANCIANAQNNDASCDATVQDWVSCAEQLGAADPCDTASVAAAQASAECATFYGDTGVCSNIN
jgi:hypothetical protein